MKGRTTDIVALVVGSLLAVACTEEKHPGAEKLAAVVGEEVKVYQSARADCEGAKARLEAFYADSGWHKRVAAAAVATIQNIFSKEEDFARDSMRILKPAYKQLDGACFEFYSTCKGDLKYLEELKKTAGAAIKKEMDTIDVGAVSRLYHTEGQLREYIMEAFKIRDPKVEARLKKLEKHRVKKRVDEVLGTPSWF